MPETTRCLAELSFGQIVQRLNVTLRSYINMTSTGMLPDSTRPLQRGSNVLWYYNGTDTDQRIRQKADLTFNYARSLHCNAIAISFPFYMEHSAASTVHGGSTTPSPEQLAIVVDVAERYGLRVNIRPLLDEDSFRPDGWRGTILPEDRSGRMAGAVPFCQKTASGGSRATAALSIRILSWRKPSEPRSSRSVPNSTACRWTIAGSHSSGRYEQCSMGRLASRTTGMFSNWGDSGRRRSIRKGWTLTFQSA